MKATNEKVNWFPAHFKYGRYLKSLENAPDWCISRSRYWGSPVPVWECKNGHLFVPGSIAELEKASGVTITDLHKPTIDEVSVTCQECGEKAKRVSEVLDSWIEAGSAPFAERHFPFDKEVKPESFFPPDFIAEYTGQIRAWFYVLHVIATALYDSHAFKNVLVTGVILGTDGRKMSKNFNNYPDPKELLQKYGGDALRLYLLGSPVMHGEDIRISELEYRNQVKGMLLLLWNVYNFFVTYANSDGWHPDGHTRTHVLDRWIISRMNGSIKKMTASYEAFDTPGIVEQAWLFIRDLSQWYVRRSRDRKGPDVYETLWTVLTEYCKALAPLIPFTTEEIYRNLTGVESVHLESWPAVGQVDEKLEQDMADGITVASFVLAGRKVHTVKVRMPLKKLTYSGPAELTDEVKSIVLSEANLYELAYTKKTKDFGIEGVWDEPNQDTAAGMARDLVREIQKLRKEKGCTIDAHITLVLPKDTQSLSKDLLEMIKKETLTDSLSWGDALTISTG
jgi:isoleucyl-tRNA synthetase